MKKIFSVILCIIFAFSFSVFASCETYIIIDGFKVSKNSEGTLSLAGFEGAESELEVPAELYGYPITSIATRAFSGNTSVKSIALPDSMTEIGSGAFSESSVASVSLGKNTKKLGSNAFYGCAALKNIDFGESLTEIPGYAFNRCSSLVKLEIPEGVKKIGEYSFYKCASLEYILIPASVTEIAKNAFNECNRLTIYGETNSAAHQYATEFSIPFVSTSGEQPTNPDIEEELRGDADGNGKIANDDARLVQMFCTGLADRSYIIFEYADANADGVVGIKDATAIQRYVVYGKF